MKPKITITIENVDLDMLEMVMSTLEIQNNQATWVLDNYQPEYKELIQGFLNKEVTFKELKQAVR